MRKLFVVVAAASFILALGASTYAKEMTVKGKVVDQTCYLKDKANTGDAHGAKADCATACAKRGAPLALLTDDGKLYQITGGLADNKNEKLIAHVAHTVEVTGDVTEKEGKMMIASDALKMISK